MGSWKRDAVLAPGSNFNCVSDLTSLSFKGLFYGCIYNEAYYDLSLSWANFVLAFSYNFIWTIFINIDQIPSVFYSSMRIDLWTDWLGRPAPLRILQNSATQQNNHCPKWNRTWSAIGRAVFGKQLSHLFDKPTISPINLLYHFDNVKGLSKITHIIGQ